MLLYPLKLAMSGDPGGNRTRDNLIKSQLPAGLITNINTTTYLLANVPLICAGFSLRAADSLMQGSFYGTAKFMLRCALSCFNVLSMNLLQVRQRLHDLCEDAGGIRKWADANGIAFSYVAAVRRGDAKPGRKLLKAMGLRKAFTDKKTTVMKFEDITN